MAECDSGRLEIGLRRALGADAAAIHRQIMGELLVLVVFGLVCGAVSIAQLWVLGLAGEVGRRVFLVTAVTAAVLTLALAMIAGSHPSRLATRTQPAEALHHD